MGVYVVDKPLGLTSFDVVAKSRKRLGTKRIGHTGTLDPLATGVLVVCSEHSTKLVQFLEGESKDYLAFVSFGASTPTLDAEGPIETQSNASGLQASDTARALEQFLGPQQQQPPAYSAIHVNGQRAYDLARAGQTPVLAPRHVTIHDIRLQTFLPSMQEFFALHYAPNTQGHWQSTTQGRTFPFPTPLGAFPTAMLNVSVSSGTYIRSLARDLGAALGLPAHLAGLVRTRVGKFTLQNAQTLDSLDATNSTPDLSALSLPQVMLTTAQAKDARDGKRLAHAHTGRFALTLEGALVAVADGDGTALKVVRAWQ